MKLNFSVTINDLEGKPIKDGDKDVTFGSICCTALLATYQGEQDLSGDEKAKRWNIALAVHKGGDQDVSVDDAALLKKLIAKAYGPLVVGRAYEIIEPHHIPPRD